MKLFNELSTSTVLHLSVKISGVAIALGSQILIARMLSPNEFGLYTFLLSTMYIFATASSFGHDIAAVRFLPEYYSSHTKTKSAQNFLNFSTKRIITLSLFAMLGFYLFISIARQQTPTATLIVFCATIPFFAINILRIGFFKAQKLFFSAELPDSVFRSGLILLVSAVAYFATTEGLSFEVLSLVTGASFFALGTYSFRSLRVKFSLKTVTDSNKKIWVGAIYFLGFSALIKMIYSRLDIVLLGVLSTTEEVARYTIPNNLANISSAVFVSINAVVATYVSQLYFKGKLNELRQLLIRVAFISTIFSLVFCAVLIAFDTFFLGLFGDHYTNCKWVLIPLLVSQVVNATMGSVGAVLSMTGEQKAAMFLGIFAIACNCLLNTILIPSKGAEGAAIASLASFSLWNMFSVLYVISSKKINTSIWQFETFKSIYKSGKE